MFLCLCAIIRGDCGRKRFMTQSYEPPKCCLDIRGRRSVQTRWLGELRPPPTAIGSGLMGDETSGHYRTPRELPAVRDFMTSFTRGNRDTARRSSAGSILQELNLMNDNTMVLSKIRMANSPRLKDIAQNRR